MQLEPAPLKDPPLATESGDASAPTRLYAALELATAVLMACVALLSAIFMSDLIGSGGIVTAREFLTLSPAFFPRISMLMLFVVCVPYAVQAARSLERSADLDTGEDLERLKRAGLMTVIAVCYAASVSWLGFILATMLVAAVVSFFLGIRRPLHFLPGVIIMPILIRLLFERGLLIALPRSEIEFVAVVEDALLRFLAGVAKFLVEILT